MSKEKLFILDTNILMYSPDCLTGFEDNILIISSVVLDELDERQKDRGESGYNAHRAKRMLKEAFNGRKEAELPNGGKIRLLPVDHYDSDALKSFLPLGWNPRYGDNILLYQVTEIIRKEKENCTDRQVFLVTNDSTLFLKALMLGIPVQDYKNERIEDDINYTGYLEVELEPEKFADIEDLTYEDIPDEVFENEFFLLKCGNASRTAIARNGKINLIDLDKMNAMGITGKNLSQKFALYALLAPASEIPLVVLKGMAGTGKTLLALAAGLAQSYGGKKCRDNIYRNVMICRPHVLTENFGAIPGDINTKLDPLMMPIKDNIEVILTKGGKEKEDSLQLYNQIEDMFFSRNVEVAPLAYLRGRSLPYRYLIIDEAQNATPAQMQLIISRVGTNTKVVLCGDPDQADIGDRYHNGVSYVAYKMKDDPLCAQVSFTKDKECVRSPLALAAAKKLKN